MRSTALTMAALSACVVLGACAAPTQDARPTVRIAEAANRLPVRALDHVLPTSDELAAVLGSAGMMGQRVQGGPDMLLASVGEADATPADCVSPAYRLQTGDLRGWSGASGGESVVGRRILRWATGVGLLRRRAVLL